MGNPSNWLDTGYDTIALDGVPLATQRTTANLIASTGVTITVVDNDETEQTDITFTAAEDAPSAPTRWSYADGGTYAFPASVNTTVWFTTAGGPITAQLPASPSDGVRAKIKDTGRALATHPLTVVPLWETQQIEYPPGTLNAAGASVILGAADLGITLSLTFGEEENTWFIDAD